MQKKCLPAIETWQITGLDIALAAPRKCLFDSHDERRNRSRDDNSFSTRNENLYCVIQSWLSAWVVRDFISHSLHSAVA